MSIASEITRIQGAKADLKTAIEAKGVTVGNGLIDTYAAKVAQISGGGGGGNAYEVSSVSEMENLSGVQDGDLCIVYNDSETPMTEDTDTGNSIFIIQKEMTLSSALTGETIFEFADTYGNNALAALKLDNSTDITIQYFKEDGSYGSYVYTTSNGTDYSTEDFDTETLTITFDSSLDISSEWDERIGDIFLIEGRGFVGLYQAEVSGGETSWDLLYSPGGAKSYNCYTVPDSMDTEEIDDADKDDLCLVLNNSRGPMTEYDCEYVNYIHIDPVVELPDEIASAWETAAADEGIHGEVVVFEAVNGDSNYYLEMSANIYDNPSAADGKYIRKLSIDVGYEQGVSLLLTFSGTKDCKSWVLNSVMDLDNNEFDIQEYDFNFETEVSYDSETSLAGPFPEYAGYFLQRGKPEFYTVLIADPTNEGTIYDTYMDESGGLRYLAFPRELKLYDTIDRPISGGFVSNNGVYTATVSLSSSQFVFELTDTNTNTVVNHIVYNSGDGINYGNTVEGVSIDMGEDMGDWLCWDFDNYPELNNSMAELLHTVNTTLTWKEIPIGEPAEPVM